VERGAATLILDRELSGERLAREIARLIADRQQLRRMSANARLFARADASERLVRSLERWGMPLPPRRTHEVEDGGAV
jgi:UDP-N-acetylglucosamine:LPS N-acetylglucosamine transferase